jgi:integrase
MLTDAKIRTQPPPAGCIELADGRGLVMRITANGVRSFGFRFRDRIAGRDERVHLGRYPDLSLRDARRRADAIRGEIANGKNPNTTRREASDRTFGALAERFMVEHSRRRKRSSGHDEGMLKNHVLPYWRNRDFTTIERSDVVKLVERIVTAGKDTMANRVQALVGGIFSFAMDAGLLKANPVSRMRRRGEEHAKTRVLSDDEIRLFWSRSPSSPIGLALKTILATGARPGEVAGMARAALEMGPDGVPSAWLNPSEKKNKPYLVPLSPMARDLLVEATSDGAAFVFRGRYGLGHVTPHALTVFMDRMGKKMPEGEPGADTWRAERPTPHDLRRTAATRLSAAGIRPEDVAAVLNHGRRDVTGKHYDLYERFDEKRAALDRWSTILSGILDPQPADKVVVSLHR